MRMDDNQDNLQDYTGSEGDSQRPLENMAELTKKLIQVKGSTSNEKKLIITRSKKTGKILSFKYVKKENPFEEILDEDMTLANLNPKEMEIVRVHSNLSNYTQLLSSQIDVDLKNHQRFIARQLKSVLVSSRSKLGFMALLTKTDKTVSESQINTMHRQQQIMEEQRKQGFLAKLFGKSV